MLERIRSLWERPSTSLQVFSDLHLEVNQQYTSLDVPIRAKHLVLAGDIGRLVDYDNYLAFLKKQTDQFENVFLVLGNHEFYNSGFADGLRKAKQLESEPSLNGRLILLHQRRFDIPESRVTVLGCSLWSHIPADLSHIVRYKIQDFSKIEGWTVEAHTAAHESDIKWLRREIQLIAEENTKLDKIEQRSIVVVTHHAPSLTGTSAPQHEKNPWSCAFGTDVLENFSDSENGVVKVWIFGHTHYCTDFRKKGVRVVANQRGYVLPWMKDESKGKFDVGKVIHVQ